MMATLGLLGSPASAQVSPDTDRLKANIEANFGDRVVVDVVCSAAGDRFVDVRPRTLADLFYFSTFHLIANNSTMKLISYQGKLIREEAAVSSIDQCKLLKSLCRPGGVRLCQGLLNKVGFVPSRHMNDVLLEHLNDDVVVRSRKCAYGLINEDETVKRCVECKNFELNMLKEEKWGRGRKRQASSPVADLPLAVLVSVKDEPFADLKAEVGMKTRSVIETRNVLVHNGDEEDEDSDKDYTPNKMQKEEDFDSNGVSEEDEWKIDEDAEDALLVDVKVEKRKPGRPRTKPQDPFPGGYKDQECPNCGRRYRALYSFERHVRKCVEGKMEELPPRARQKRRKGKKVKTAEVKKEEEDCRESCKVCLREFGKRGDFERHLKLHREKLNLDEPASCPVCAEKLESKMDLNPHYLDKHATDGATGCCVECGTICPKDVLQRHLAK
jgi:hypothetical protein